MGGEPEAGVEDGAHLFERVAIAREEVGDEQGGEAGNATDEVAHARRAFAEGGFHQQPEQHRAPADEDGGGVEVGDGRIAGEEDAGNNGEGVRDKGAGHQRASRAEQPLFAQEPAKEAQDKDKQVELGGFHEGTEAVVEHLEAELVEHRRVAGLEHRPVPLESGVEKFRIPVAVGGEQGFPISGSCGGAPACCAHGRRDERDGGGKGGAGIAEGGLDVAEEIHLVGHLHGLAVVEVALAVVLGIGGTGSGIEFSKGWKQLAVGIAEALAFLQPEIGEHIEVFDAENAVVHRLRPPRNAIGQPLHRRDFFALLADGLFARKHRQEISGQRVDRFFAPLEFDRQPGEGIELEVRRGLFRRPCPALEKPDGKEDNGNMGNRFSHRLPR